MLKDDEDSLKMAKRDAKWSIQLWPCWWRGYHRLAHVQMKLEEWHAAEKSLDKASALNPQSKEVQDDLSEVRAQAGIFTREEHLNPIYHPFTKKDIIEDNCKKLGISEEQYKKLEKANLDLPIIGDVIRGHQFRDGIDAPQDFKKAAAFYAKAAAHENPEAMFNLGKLHHFGHGVARDYNESMRWLLKAANSKPEIMVGTDSYVSDAQHMLGLKY
uniref:Uncharacterized protein n=1 Tax=Panagrolaimus sp. ES5 TaxID=591445 RepID=A0AC34GI37_9BILA